jgi:hypothetical protein
VTPWATPLSISSFTYVWVTLRAVALLPHVVLPDKELLIVCCTLQGPLIVCLGSWIHCDAAKPNAEIHVHVCVCSFIS